MSLTRRQLLVLGGCGMAMHSGLLHGRSMAGATMRIGVVLPGNACDEGCGIAADAARRGAEVAGEEYGFNAELLGRKLDVRVVRASGSAAVKRAAGRLVDEGAFALVGGCGDDDVLTLGDVASGRSVLNLNIGAAADVFRGVDCNRHTFHIEPSAAMYLDALSAWFVRAGFRHWHFVVDDTEPSAALHQRAAVSLKRRHWGAREVSRSQVCSERPDWDSAAHDARRSGADLVVLLVSWQRQLDALAACDRIGLEATVTGFPYPTAQTREFFSASQKRSPHSGTGWRAAPWEATLDRYGARELNARFQQRWSMPMDGPAWCAYQAVRILYEAASAANSLDADRLIAHLEHPSTAFDAHKGIGVSFRPWDHQLRQPLYLVKIHGEAQNSRALASLEGELPALYMPGTDPLERLDQLGEPAKQSTCEY